MYHHPHGCSGPQYPPQYALGSRTTYRGARAASPGDHHSDPATCVGPRPTFLPVSRTNGIPGSGFTCSTSRCTVQQICTGPLTVLRLSATAPAVLYHAGKRLKQKSQKSKKERVRGTMLVQSHQLLFTIKHSPPPLGFPNYIVLSMQ